MHITKRRLAVGLGGALFATAAYAATQLDFTTPIELSNQAPDLGVANKTKLSRLGNGTLIAVYGDGVNAANMVYDVKGDKDRPARDIFVRTCASATVDCSMEANWSAPANISGTATLSSIDADWDGDTDLDNTRKTAWGDSEKPNIGNAGTRLAVSWVDKYCPDGDIANPGVDPTVQRTVSYLVRDNREVPFSCMYIAYSHDSGTTWSNPVQLSNAERDAKQDVSKGASDGKWISTWQEDPLGLQLGEAEGPGEGASGAKVSHGTDVWYTSTPPGWSAAGGGDAVWSTPVRLTDNVTSGSASGNFDIIRDTAGNIVPNNNIDGGIAGASRANAALVGTTAIVAYEETKGASGLDEGKFIRYHNFTYNGGTSGEAGCIISDPAENSRRVRFVPQGTPGAVSGTTMGIFWRQGLYDQGGPADIILRRGTTDFTPANMMPAVDANCATSDYLMAIQLNSMPGVNLSSETPTATAANLGDISDANNIENALAHRALLRGDDLYVGWSYTPDWAVATFTTLENYNFWLRHYDGTTDTWTNPVNLSNITDTTINVREPRLVGTPSSSNPNDPQDKSAFVIAWGTQTNVPSHIGGAQELDIFYTRTFDKGATFEPVVSVPNPAGNARFESQLRPTPGGDTVYMVWNEEGSVNAMFSIGTTVNAPAGGGGGGGCTLGNSRAVDPLMPAMVLLALGYLGLRRRSRV